MQTHVRIHPGGELLHAYVVFCAMITWGVRPGGKVGKLLLHIGIPSMVLWCVTVKKKKKKIKIRSAATAGSKREF